MLRPFANGPAPEPGRVRDLVSASARLDVALEVFSEEVGMGFQEHYLADRGHIVLEEVAEDYEVYLLDLMTEKEIAELAGRLGVDVSELSEAAKESGEYIVGGFEHFEDFSALDELASGRAAASTLAGIGHDAVAAATRNENAGTTSLPKLKEDRS